jgi:hypothetical protein
MNEIQDAIERLKNAEFVFSSRSKSAMKVADLKYSSEGGYYPIKDYSFGDDLKKVISTLYNSIDTVPTNVIKHSKYIISVYPEKDHYELKAIINNDNDDIKAALLYKMFKGCQFYSITENQKFNLHNIMDKDYFDNISKNMVALEIDAHTKSIHDAAEAALLHLATRASNNCLAAGDYSADINTLQMLIDEENIN